MSGTVTNPTGTVSGISLTGLIDAYTGNFSGSTVPIGPVMAQWQYLTLLSDMADPCAHEGSGLGFRPNETTLRFVLTGYIELPGNAPVYPPAADLPLVLTVGTPTTTSDGVHRLLSPYVMKARSNGNPGTDRAATSGTLTLTVDDTGGMSGAWDLLFGADHTTGSFTAPWCGTAP